MWREGLHGVRQAAPRGPHRPGEGRGGQCGQAGRARTEQLDAATADGTLGLADAPVPTAPAPGSQTVRAVDFEAATVPWIESDDEEAVVEQD
jgi:hypothetical protein